MILRVIASLLLVLLLIPGGLGCVPGRDRRLVLLGGYCASLAVFEVFQLVFHVTAGSLRLMTLLWCVLCAALAVWGYARHGREVWRGGYKLPKLTHIEWLLFALGAAVVVSRSAGTPLLNMFIYTPELFDVRRIEQTVAANGEERAYQKLLANSSWILAGTLVASSIGNFFLSLSFMSSVIQQPEAEQQVAYNAAIGSITWWGFLIIGIPILAALVFIMTRLIKRLGRLTGLSRDELLLK